MTESHRDMIEMTAEPVPPTSTSSGSSWGPRATWRSPTPTACHLQAYEASRDEMVAAIPSIIAYLSKLPIEALARG